VIYIDLDALYGKRISVYENNVNLK
jgi:hypothetical protein